MKGVKEDMMATTVTEVDEVDLQKVMDTGDLLW